MYPPSASPPGASRQQTKGVGVPNPKDPPPAVDRALPPTGLVALSGADVDRLAGGSTALAHVLRRVALEAATPSTEPRAPFESAIQ
jgi:FXSXX-COOH protein